MASVQKYNPPGYHFLSVGIHLTAIFISLVKTHTVTNITDLPTKIFYQLPFLKIKKYRNYQASVKLDVEIKNLVPE
jgi:hypothetical protein